MSRCQYRREKLKKAVFYDIQILTSSNLSLLLLLLFYFLFIVISKVLISKRINVLLFIINKYNDPSKIYSPIRFFIIQENSRFFS